MGEPGAGLIGEGRLSVLGSVWDAVKRYAAAITHFPASWIEALSADGGGPPNWFWPSCQTLTILSLSALGFFYANDRSGYVLSVLPILGTFVGVTFALWLSHRRKRGTEDN
jgi:hypothetical protein